ncbi:hypothetical protein DAPPUDRAFT_307175 [Daphnia pulex]|uniref:Uncharacterized protein n=1 Tax=Daphnia pulex TaxID=6669 RepID=E9H0U9_DAPPU|nr:hypothetical protein DAPPUDRAFT_307175 [Daphnia pulex]|eukprot:EFX74519.1 hypothetical protein DAPPUDRAFT_307175 [Daphnia pulex]
MNTFVDFEFHLICQFIFDFFPSFPNRTSLKFLPVILKKMNFNPPFHCDAICLVFILIFFWFDLKLPPFSSFHSNRANLTTAPETFKRDCI